jgi:hypothetical protein
MTETIIMRGAYAITDPRLGARCVIPAGAVVIVDGTIRETGPFAAIASKYPGRRERRWLNPRRRFRHAPKPARQHIHGAILPCSLSDRKHIHIDLGPDHFITVRRSLC